nr:type II secretion system protein GspG [uncultured Rhodoferax sp.]
MRRYVHLRWAAAVAGVALLFSIGGVVTAESSLCPSYVDGSQIGWVQFRIMEIEGSLEMYQLEKNALPPTLNTLMPEYLKRLREDDWGNPFVYRVSPGVKGYMLYSRGANGIDEFGDGDDITTDSKQYTCKQYQERCWTPCEVFKIISYATSLLSSLVLSVLGVLFAILFIRNRSA